MAKKNIKIWGSALLVLLLITLGQRIRLIEYFGITKSSIVIENNSSVNIAIKFIYPLKGRYSERKGQEYFDTLILYQDNKLITKALPDHYGENEFVIEYNGIKRNINCGFFKFRKWYKYKMHMHISEKGGKLIVRWYRKMNFSKKKGVDEN